MQLYEINTNECLAIHVVACTPDEAVDLFVTWRAASGGIDELITVQRLPVEKLKPEQQGQVRSAFAAGLIGISHFDEEIGWTFSPPLWVPLGSDEQPQTRSDGEQR